MSSVYITDYVSNPNIEKKILNKKLSARISSKVRVLLVWHQKINSSYLDQFPNLEGIVRYGVGIDSVDLKEVKKRKLILCNTPDYGVDEVSDTAIAMIMNFQRGILKYNNLAKNLFSSWETNTIKSLKRTSSTKLGILGAGMIGASVAIKAKALGFQVSFFDPFKESGFEKTLRVKRFFSLTDLLNDSDVVSIHLPLNKETKGLVDKKFLDSMKKNSFLINTSRGGIIKDIDLIYHNLINKKLGGIGFDVLPSEPPKRGLLIDAWRSDKKNFRDKIIITPHTSYFSREAYIEMRKSAAQCALDIIRKKNPKNIVIDAR